MYLKYFYGWWSLYLFYDTLCHFKDLDLGISFKIHPTSMDFKNSDTATRDSIA